MPAQDARDRQRNHAWGDQTSKRLLARSRLVLNEGHPAQPVHLLFFSRLLPLLAHRALRCPSSAGRVVVVSVTVPGSVAVLVEEPWQEQQRFPMSAEAPH